MSWCAVLHGAHCAERLAQPTATRRRRQVPLARYCAEGPAQPLTKQPPAKTHSFIIDHSHLVCDHVRPGILVTGSQQALCHPIPLGGIQPALPCKVPGLVCSNVSDLHLPHTSTAAAHMLLGTLAASPCGFTMHGMKLSRSSTSAASPSDAAQPQQ